MRNVSSSAAAILGIAAVLQVGAQSTNREADYTNRARQAVESALQKSGQSPGQLRIEVVDGPLLAPDHVSLHRREAALSSGKAKLSGRVVSAAAEPVAGLRLLLRQIGVGGLAEPVSAVTSLTGEFQFPDIPPGKYEIQRGSGSEALSLMLEAGHHRVLLSDNPEGYLIFGTTKVSFPFPSAIVMGAYNGANLVRMNGVGINGSQAEILWTVDTATAARDLGSTLLDNSSGFEDFGGVASLPSEAERKQLREDLVPLLSALFDVARGTDRLKPLLSSRVICRFYYSGERRFPNIDNQRCAAFYLDMMTLGLWVSAEAEGEMTLGRDLYGDPGVPDEQTMALALRTLEVFRNELRGAGMFEREHSSRIQQALRALIAVSPIARVTINESRPNFPLPRGDLYMIGAPPIFLIREGRELRVVGVFLGGG